MSITPSLSWLRIVNHRLPSSAAVMVWGRVPFASWNSVTTPFGVIRPIVSPPGFVNHMFPSGPGVIQKGSNGSSS